MQHIRNGGAFKLPVQRMGRAASNRIKYRNSDRTNYTGGDSILDSCSSLISLGAKLLKGTGKEVTKVSGPEICLLLHITENEFLPEACMYIQECELNGP